MQLVQLRDDAVIAGYDYVWEPFADAAAKAGQRTDAAIATDVLDSRNKLKRVARRINGADAASTANQGNRQARRRWPPLCRDYQD